MAVNPSRWPLRIRLPIWNWLTNIEKSKRSIGNIALDYKVHGLEDLRFNLNMGYDIQKNDNRENVPDLAPSMYTGNQNDGTGKRYKYHQTKRNTLLDFYANYDKELKDHHINVMGWLWLATFLV